MYFFIYSTKALKNELFLFSASFLGTDRNPFTALPLINGSHLYVFVEYCNPGGQWKLLVKCDLFLIQLAPGGHFIVGLIILSFVKQSIN